MRVPQEIVDAIIDYFGVPLDQSRSHDPIFYRWDLDKRILNSWALVSKACNHRVRYYLFSHCKIIAKPSSLRTFAQCPDVLLTYTRFLYIYRPRNPEDIQSIISRFSSSPLIRVKFESAQILAGFPAVFRSFLPDLRSVQFEKCLFDPIALVRLRGHLELREVVVCGGCVASGILESIEDIRAGIPRRLPDGSGGVEEVTGCVLRSLGALRLESTADRMENELVKACAKSLQFIEIKTKTDWASLAFCLDIGTCSKLRSITLESTLTETATISNLVALLSTLRNPSNLYRIRVFASNISPATFEPRTPSQLDGWRRLDDLLCGLCPQQTRKEDCASLTFQIAARKVATPLVESRRLFGLLPRFSRVGTCEEVEV